ncbi:MAG: hypothetical protein KAJ58_00625 [Candidatus Pacebacteria bacterium]|nr:hypothetical protein [Candidatus Paceibacterota bacterium]
MRKKIKNKIKKILEINTSILVLVIGILIFSGITSAALIYGIVSDSKASLVGYWPLDEESEKRGDEFLSNGNCESAVPTLDSSGGGTRVTTALSTTVVHTGSNSVKMTLTEDTSDGYYAMGNGDLNGLETGKTYVYSGYVYNPSSGGISTQVILYFYDYNESYSQSSQYISTKDEWVPFSVTKTITSDATQVFFRVKAYGLNTEYLYFDDLSVKEIKVGDKTGNSNDGTIYGPTYTTDQMGQSNRAMSFDGVDDYININDVANDVGTDVTISGWVKAIPHSVSDAFVCVNTSAGNNRFLLFIDEDNKFRAVDTNTTEAISTTVVADNTWHYLTYTKNGSAGKLYVDGVEEASHTADFVLASTDQWSIGQEYDAAAVSNFFPGSISDVRIYNKALTATEIQSLYEQYRPKTQVSNLQKGLVGHWPLDSESEKGTNGGFDVSTAVYDSVFSVLAQSLDSRAVAFSTDGTKMFILDKTGAEVNEYHCSTGFDVSTCSYDSLFSIASQDTGAQGMIFNPTGTKMFLSGSANDSIYEYHCSTAFDVSTCVYDSVLSVAAQDVDPEEVTFNTDGSKMFVVGNSGNDINEYHCTTGFDISTCSYDSVFSVSAQEAEPNGIAFNPNGTKMLIVGGTGDNVYEYHCTAGFDVSTCSYDSAFSVATQEINPHGITFNTTGTKMFIVGNDGDEVNEYHLDEGNMTSGDKTPYENDGTISGAILTTDQMGQANRAMSFDGTNDYVQVANSSSINSENITVGLWAKSDTATWNQTCSLVSKRNAYILSPMAGTKEIRFYFYDTVWHAVGYTTDVDLTEWHHYLGTYDGTNIKIYIDGVEKNLNAISSSINIADTGPLYIGWDDGVAGRYFGGDISDIRIYNRALNTTEINDLYHSYRPKVSPGSLQKGLVGSWPLDTESEKTKQGGFDVSTAVYDSVFSVSAQDTAPTGLAFNTDGTRMFMIGMNTDYVWEYHCTTGFDISTCTVDSGRSISAQETTPLDLAFSADGTKMFVVGTSGNDVNEYHCSTGFDVGTCNYDSVFSVNSQESDPNGIAFNTEGTRMFIIGNYGNDINEYHCTTGFDVSTCSYDSVFSVSTQEISPYGMIFNKDGTKMYVIGATGQDVNEYHCTTAFDVSTCSYDSVFSVSTQETSPAGIRFNNDGSKMFVVGISGDEINEYHLDPPVSITGDKTPYSNDGTITGPTSTTGKDGESDGALSFDGVDDYINLGDGSSVNVTGSQTISMWLYPTNFSARRNPINKAYGGEGTITQELDGDLNYYYGTAGGNAAPYQSFRTTSPLTLNTWNHLVLTRDLDNMVLKWYLNGEEITSVAASYSSATASSADLIIGDGYTSNYAGKISDVNLYNRALSAEEVDLLYHRR